MTVHPLRMWRASKRMSLKVLGAKVGVSDAMLSYVENYQKQASGELIKRIEDVTLGAVKRADFRRPQTPVKNPTKS